MSFPLEALQALIIQPNMYIEKMISYIMVQLAIKMQMEQQ